MQTTIQYRVLAYPIRTCYGIGSATWVLSTAITSSSPRPPRPLEGSTRSSSTTSRTSCPSGSAADDRRGKDDKKLKTTEKVRQAVKGDEKNRNDTNMNIYKNNLNICTNRCIQEPYGFFIDVGNEGDEGLFFD